MSTDRRTITREDDSADLNINPSIYVRSIDAIGFVSTSEEHGEPIGVENIARHVSSDPHYASPLNIIYAMPVEHGIDYTLPNDDNIHQTTTDTGYACTNINVGSNPDVEQYNCTHYVSCKDANFALPNVALIGLIGTNYTRTIIDTSVNSSVDQQDTTHDTNDYILIRIGTDVISFEQYIGPIVNAQRVEIIPRSDGTFSTGIAIERQNPHESHLHIMKYGSTDSNNTIMHRLEIAPDDINSAGNVTNVNDVSSMSIGLCSAGIQFKHTSSNLCNSSQYYDGSDSIEAWSDLMNTRILISHFWQPDGHTMSSVQFSSVQFSFHHY